MGDYVFHSPYSPDLSPTDFHLFLNLDNHMRNKQFNNESDLKEMSRFFRDEAKDFNKIFL